MEALYGTGVTAEELEGARPRARSSTEFLDDALDVYDERETEIEAIHEGLMRDLERFMVLQVVDVRWREHLENMDYLREGIHLRGMAQKDPLVEYRNEGHIMFHGAEPRDPRGGVDAPLPRADRARRPDGERRCAAAAAERQRRTAISYEHETAAGAEAIVAAGAAAAPATARATAAASTVAPRPVVKSEQESIGRNDPCWCGSGKKYKRCHGA